MRQISYFFAVSALALNLACQTTKSAESASHAAPATTAAIDKTSLIAFSTDEGMTRLERAKAKKDFFPLANHFESQSNAIVCGPTTAAIVLNSFHVGKGSNLPAADAGLKKTELKNLPKGFDPSFKRYTQQAILEKSPKKRSVVFGEPVSINGKKASDFGYQLRQFDELLEAHGLKSEHVVVDDKISLDQVRQTFIDNLASDQDFVVVNYQRKAVGQEGGGHISPIGAYDEASDSFLVLDVNPNKASWVWMPAATLYAGMKTYDTVENRGYVLVSQK